MERAPVKDRILVGARLSARQGTAWAVAAHAEDSVFMGVWIPVRADVDDPLGSAVEQAVEEGSRALHKPPVRSARAGTWADLSPDRPLRAVMRRYTAQYHQVWRARIQADAAIDRVTRAAEDQITESIKGQTR